MPLFYVVLRLACVILWVHVFVEYMAIDLLKYVSVFMGLMAGYAA